MGNENQRAPRSLRRWPGILRKRQQEALKLPVCLFACLSNKLVKQAPLSQSLLQSNQGLRGTVMVPRRTERSTKVIVKGSRIGQKSMYFISGPGPLKTN